MGVDYSEGGIDIFLRVNTPPTHRCYDGRPALSYDEELSKNPLMIAYILWIFLIGVLGLVDPMSIVP